MRIGEEVFAIHPSRKWSNTPNRAKNRPHARNCRWPNYVMGALAKSAIRVSGAVRVKMHKLDGGPEDEQECEEGDEHNTGHWIRRP